MYLNNGIMTTRNIESYGRSPTLAIGHHERTPMPRTPYPIYVPKVGKMTTCNIESYGRSPTLALGHHEDTPMPRTPYPTYVPKVSIVTT